MTTIPQQKKLLRATMKERRAAFAAQHPDAATQLRDNFLHHMKLPPQAIVSAYKTLDSEIDPAPLVEVLRQQGHIIALPFVWGKDQPLSFHRYEAGDILTPSAFGVHEPAPHTDRLTPDIVLIPLLAFDSKGYRLGYGGGFYDRTLAVLRRQKPILAIGLGFSCQQIDAVPRAENDAHLDQIFTENQHLSC
jgi:5-formyltetrahydrofolate cyclo-ligase